MAVLSVYTTCSCSCRSRRCATITPCSALLSAGTRSILLTTIRAAAMAGIYRCAVCGSRWLRGRSGGALVVVALLLVRLSSYWIVTIIVLSISRCHNCAETRCCATRHGGRDAMIAPSLFRGWPDRLVSLSHAGDALVSLSIGSLDSRHRSR